MNRIPVEFVDGLELEGKGFETFAHLKHADELLENFLVFLLAVDVSAAGLGQNLGGHLVVGEEVDRHLGTLGDSSLRSPPDPAGPESTFFFYMF